MGDDEFYEDDESVEELRAAWNAGEKGTTTGPRDLDQRDKSIVDRGVTQLEERHDVLLTVVDSGTTARTTVYDWARGPVLDRVEDEPVTAAAYRVG